MFYFISTSETLLHYRLQLVYFIHYTEKVPTRSRRAFEICDRNSFPSPPPPSPETHYSEHFRKFVAGTIKTNCRNLSSQTNLLMAFPGLVLVTNSWTPPIRNFVVSAPLLRCRWPEDLLRILPKVLQISPKFASISQEFAMGSSCRHPQKHVLCTAENPPRVFKMDLWMVKAVWKLPKWFADCIKRSADSQHGRTGMSEQVADYHNRSRKKITREKLKNLHFLTPSPTHLKPYKTSLPFNGQEVASSSMV